MSSSARVPNVAGHKEKKPTPCSHVPPLLPSSPPPPPSLPPFTCPPCSGHTLAPSSPPPPPPPPLAVPPTHFPAQPHPSGAPEGCPTGFGALPPHVQRPLPLPRHCCCWRACPAAASDVSRLQLLPPPGHPTGWPPPATCHRPPPQRLRGAARYRRHPHCRRRSGRPPLRECLLTRPPLRHLMRQRLQPPPARQRPLHHHRDHHRRRRRPRHRHRHRHCRRRRSRKRGQTAVVGWGRPLRHQKHLVEGGDA